MNNQVTSARQVFSYSKVIQYISTIAATNLNF